MHSFWVFLLHGRPLLYHFKSLWHGQHCGSLSQLLGILLCIIQKKKGGGGLCPESHPSSIQERRWWLKSSGFVPRAHSCEMKSIMLPTRLQWVEAPTCLTQGSRRESLTRHSCAGFPTVSLPFPATLFSGTTFPSKPAANKTLYQALLWEEPG